MSDEVTLKTITSVSVRPPHVFLPTKCPFRIRPDDSLMENLNRLTFKMKHRTVAINVRYKIQIEGEVGV